jgi:aspartate 1-decarboxylase
MTVFRTFLRAKIHRAVVSAADLHYNGSLTVDQTLLEASGMREYEMVQVVNVENGARFETYLIAGEHDTGVVQVNGAAARLAAVGDHIIVMAYAQVSEPVPDVWDPRIVLVDERNRILQAQSHGGEPCC